MSPYHLEPIDPDKDFPDLVRIMLESYEDPPSNLYKMFGPVFGEGPEARAAALKEHAERFADWHRTDLPSFWHKAIDDATGEIGAAALWRIYESTPFPTNEAGDQDHSAYWYPEGGQREFVTQAISQLEAPHKKYGNRPHVFLNIIYTHPAHRKRGAADLILRWGIEKAKDLGLEMWLDAFPPAWGLYPKYGFTVVSENNLRPQTENPDQDWLRLEKELLPLTARTMWRPKDGPYVPGKSVKPWEENVS